MKNNRKTIISLTGGLGNQLFQLAVGLFAAQGNKLTLEWTVGKPRLNKDSLPEVTTFQLPENVILEKSRKNNWLVGKTTGYMLRMGFDPKSYEKIFGYFWISRRLANLVITIYFRNLYKIYPGRKLGYDDLANVSKGNFIVGYFQSYKWAVRPDVLSKLKSLRIMENDSKLSELKVLAELENPLIVHIRLGDYKNEDGFGILPKAYYEKAIGRMWETGKYKKVWAFSDEPELAQELLLHVNKNDIRWINEIGGSASKTLEAMRMGQGYVIGNSTFSWWGAFLSYSPNAKVIAPKPWFRNIAIPEDLIPPHWDSEVSWLSK